MSDDRLVSVAEIAEGNAALHPFQQGQCRGTVIPVTGGQHQIHYASVNVAQHMQLKTKEPPLAGFAKPRAVFPQQAHAPMSHRMTNRKGLGIHQVKRRTVIELLRGGL